MKNIFSFIAVLIVLVFAGCDKVLIPQQPQNTTVAVNDTFRKILIEDFTGHFCQNCPAAAEMVDSLSNAYPGQVIGVGVHIDFFAEPCPPHAPYAGMLPGTFTEDFRVLAEDADYDQVFGTNSYPLPTGFVNRFPYAAPLPTAVTQWPSAVSTILQDSMTAYIKIHPTYNATTRVLNVYVTGIFMCDTTGTYNVTLYLVENGLQGSQVDATIVPGGIDNNYTFNHVFRGCINSPGTIGGQLAASGTITNGQLISTTPVSFTVSPNFNADNCHIVGFLYNTADHGVLQAAEEDLQ